jgi:hypothetical protein
MSGEESGEPSASAASSLFFRFSLHLQHLLVLTFCVLRMFNHQSQLLSIFFPTYSMSSLDATMT